MHVAAAPLLGAISLGLDAANNITRTINHRARYGSGRTASFDEEGNDSGAQGEVTDALIELKTEQAEGDEPVADSALELQSVTKENRTGKLRTSFALSKNGLVCRSAVFVLRKVLTTTQPLLDPAHAVHDDMVCNASIMMHMLSSKAP